MAAALVAALGVHLYEYSLIGAVLGFTVAAVVSAPRSGDRGWTPLDVAVGALTVTMFLAMLASEARFVSEVAFTRFLALPVAYAAARSTGAARTAAAVAVAGFVVAVHTLWGVWSSGSGGQSLFPNPNETAAWVGAAAVFALPLAVGTPSRTGRLIVGIGYLAAGAALGAIFSRGALLGTLIALGTYAALSWRQWLDAERAAPALVSLIVGTLAFALFFSPVAERKAARTVDAPESVMDSRTMMWRSAAPMLAANPVAGIGPGMTMYRWQQHRLPSDHSAGYHLHNDFLQYALEAGWPAGLILASLPLLAVARAWRLRGAAAAGGAAAVVALAVHALFSFNLQLMPMLVLFGAALGSAAVGSSPTPPPRAATIVGAVVLAWFGAQAVLLGALKPSPPVAGDVTQIQRSMAGLDRMLRFRPDADEVRVQQADLLRQALPHLPPGPRHEAVARASESAYQRAASDNPYSYAARHGLGVLYLDLRRSAAEVEPPLRAALQLQPQAPATRYLLARVLVADGRSDEALALLREGLAFASDPRLGMQQMLGLTVEQALKVGDFATATHARDLMARMASAQLKE